MSEIEAQEARETASLGSLPSEAPSARPGGSQGRLSLRQRVEAACDEAQRIADHYGPPRTAEAVQRALLAVRAALEPPPRTPRAERERIRRQAEFDAGRCAQGCGRDRRHAKRTCGLCPGSRPRAAKDG